MFKRSLILLSLAQLSTCMSENQTPAVKKICSTLSCHMKDIVQRYELELQLMHQLGCEAKPEIIEEILPDDVDGYQKDLENGLSLIQSGINQLRSTAGICQDTSQTRTVFDSASLWLGTLKDSLSMAGTVLGSIKLLYDSAQEIVVHLRPLADAIKENQGYYRLAKTYKRLLNSYKKELEAMSVGTFERGVLLALIASKFPKNASAVRIYKTKLARDLRHLDRALGLIGNVQDKKGVQLVDAAVQFKKKLESISALLLLM